MQTWKPAPAQPAPAKSAKSRPLHTIWHPAAGPSSGMRAGWRSKAATPPGCLRWLRSVPAQANTSQQKRCQEPIHKQTAAGPTRAIHQQHHVDNLKVAPDLLESHLRHMAGHALPKQLGSPPMHAPRMQLHAWRCALPRPERTLPQQVTPSLGQTRASWSPSAALPSMAPYCSQRAGPAFQSRQGDAIRQTRTICLCRPVCVSSPCSQRRHQTRSTKACMEFAP